MKELIDKLLALQQSGAMDEKSLVVVPSNSVWWLGTSDEPQSFFRDGKLIAAIQAAKSGKLSLRNAAEGIRDAVMEIPPGPFRTRPRRCLYVQLTQYDAQVHPHRWTSRPRLTQEDLDSWIVDLFEVREVTGPARVTCKWDNDSPSWEVKSLREELVELMREMES